MKKLKLLFELIIVLWLLSGCTANNTYKRANSLYKKNNYVAAIQFYDQFLQKESSGIYTTFAHLERSDSYYQLGLKAYERENWLLAQKLLFLANSETADETLDNCYFNLAASELASGNSEKAMEYYDYILKNLNTSEMIPQILIKRIKLNTDDNKEDEILSDYQRLYINYPESDTSSFVTDIVDTIIENKTVSTRAELNKDNYQTVLAELTSLAEFPTVHKPMISRNIAETYLFIADILIEAKEYGKVVTNLQKALEYDPALHTVVEAKLEETFGYFITHGNSLANELRFDEALAVFDQCLDIYPDYSPAQEARQKVEKEKWNYLQALELKEEAEEKEVLKEYQQALKLYEQANYHFKMQELQEKIFTMKNLLRADKEPRVFALDLVQGYKNGRIVSHISKLVNDLKTQYGDNLIVTSEWDVQYSTGNYKYEVRYDILTPEVNYYFVWLADLRKGIISPLNKISEELM
jgi:tetratricopeptide (TPR) repeat protein